MRAARLRFFLLLAVGFFAFSAVSEAQMPGGPLPTGIRIQFDQDSQPAEVSQSLQIVLLLTVLSLAPAIVVMTTSFTRILVVMGFVRRALGTQTVPSGQILTGLSVFLTIFIMAPVWKQINTTAIQPYMNNEITQMAAWQAGVVPLRKFMASQTGKEELALFLELAGEDKATKLDEVGMEVLMPAFMVSELKTSFQLGFLVYLPFLVIDLVVATILMSLGMMMLPPMMISLPVKLLFFVLADGWNLMIRGIVSSFTGVTF